MIFGLTGGIASGKSTVSRTFIKNNIPIIDADIIARQVVEPGTDGLHSIVEMFGSEMLLPDDTLNRAKLAELVFSHPDLKLRQESMNALNSLMAPLIQEERARQLNKLRADGHSIVGYDASLICENGHADRYRPLIVVHCPQDMQVARLMSRNGLTKQQSMDRISAQMPLDAKLDLANYIIYTWFSIQESIFQTEMVIKQLKSSIK